MNIIYINHYAGSPEMGREFRTYYLSREWVKMGHNVTIIAGDYSHLRIKNPKVEHDFQREEIDGIEYLWVKTGLYEGNGMSRALTMFRFVCKLMRNEKNGLSFFCKEKSLFPLRHRFIEIREGCQV